MDCLDNNTNPSFQRGFFFEGIFFIYHQVFSGINAPGFTLAVINFYTIPIFAPK